MVGRTSLVITLGGQAVTSQRPLHPGLGLVLHVIQSPQQAARGTMVGAHSTAGHTPSFLLPFLTSWAAPRDPQVQPGLISDVSEEGVWRPA